MSTKTARSAAVSRPRAPFESEVSTLLVQLRDWLSYMEAREAATHAVDESATAGEPAPARRGSLNLTALLEHSDSISEALGLPDRDALTALVVVIDDLETIRRTQERVAAMSRVFLEEMKRPGSQAVSRFSQQIQAQAAAIRQSASSTIQAEAIAAFTSPAAKTARAHIHEMMAALKESIGAQLPAATAIAEIKQIGGLRNSEIAAAVGARATSTVRAWANGTRNPNTESARRLLELHETLRRAARFTRPDEIPTWIRRPIPALRDRTILATLGQDEFPEVSAIVGDLENVGVS